ncbi:hypothetical protein OIU78_030172 [Salix suchowensis]|nr:hypothetical protein OIU78_030172 [Salix suchowensis]
MRAAAKQAYNICRDCRRDNTIPGLGPFGGGIGSAIGGGSDRSGGEPSFGNGDGSGRSDNTIPGSGPFGGGIGSAIGGGSDRSGGEPSFGNGDGSGRSDNTIPGLVRLYFAHYEFKALAICIL